MKRIRIAILAAAVLALLAFPATALAEHVSGSTDWNVTFNSNEQLVDNFSDKTWADDINGLQPGDDITFTVALNHSNTKSADWYFSNEVLKTLEERAQNDRAAGSAYQYKLTYTDPAGTPRTLYDSERVGGDDTEGLKEATNALDEFMYLDNLKNGEKAYVDLKVTLDGETEGNAYFDTLAQLKMKFAVELNENNDTPNKPTTPTTPTRPSVQTGDNTNLFPFFVAMAVSGALLMVLAIYSLRLRKRENEHVPSHGRQQ